MWVKLLKDALAYHYDVFYDEQPKVRFDECALGYIWEVEGPQHANAYEEWNSDRSKLKMRKQPSFVY